MSFLRHPGLAQTLVQGCFGEGTHGRGLEADAGPEAGDAWPIVFPAPPPGFGELRGGAFVLALEGIGSGEAGVDVWECLIRAARFLEPADRVVDLRLQ